MEKSTEGESRNINLEVLEIRRQSFIAGRKMLSTNLRITASRDLYDCIVHAITMDVREVVNAGVHG